MKSVCGPDIHMKAILAIGELASMNNVYKASLVCMMAGADFIKTSTGKEAVNAILPVGVVVVVVVEVGALVAVSTVPPTKTKPRSQVYVMT